VRRHGLTHRGYSSDVVEASTERTSLLADRRFGTASRCLVAVAALLLGALAVSTLATSHPAAAQSSEFCDDGRAWTADRIGSSACEHTNLCAPDSIELARPDDLEWQWRFPASCPIAAIDAVGVVVVRQVSLSPTGDLSLGTAVRLESRGTAEPGRTGAGSSPYVCGDIELQFTVIAGTEVVATAIGSSTGAPCPGPLTQPGPTPLLEIYHGSEGITGAFARLYWAVFGRVPDPDGFGYWMARSTAGLSLRDAATTWTGLPEWTATYAGTSNSDFLGAVYLNVLGRQPDSTGFAYWLERLGIDLTRQELVVLFSGSDEFKARTGTL
jgi:hypothetical protein